MAKRKNRPKRDRSPIQPIKNYRDEKYTPYIFRAETGILEAWTMDPDLRDGDVRQTLRDMMRPMKQTGEFPPSLQTGSDDSSQDISLIEFRIADNLKQAFDEHDPLTVEDTIGILSVINSSVGTWNRGMRGQEYLKYIRDFLGGAGVEVRQLTDEEVREMELLLPDGEDNDDDEPPKKKKFLGLF